MMRLKTGLLIAIVAATVPVLLLWSLLFLYWTWDSRAPVIVMMDDLPPPIEYPLLVDRAVDANGKSVPFLISSRAEQGGLIVAAWPLHKLRMCPGGVTVSALSMTRNFAAPLSVVPSTLPRGARGWFYFGYTIPKQLCPDRYRLNVYPRHTCNMLGDTVAVFEGPQFTVTGEDYEHCRAFAGGEPGLDVE